MKISSLANVVGTEAFNEIIAASLIHSIRKLSRGGFGPGADRLEGTHSDWLATHVRRIDQAARELQDAISLLRATDVGLTKIQSLLGRARQLALETGDTVGKLEAMTKQLERAASANIFSALAANIGSVDRLLGEDAGVLGLRDMSAAASAIENLGGIKTPSRRLELIDAAIGAVSADRAHLNAYISNLAARTPLLTVSATNANAAISRITDLDMACSVLNTTKCDILAREKVFTAGQANQKRRNIFGPMR